MPESHVTDTRLVDTNTLTDYDNRTIYGAEAAGVFGPFSLQGEYIQTNVSLGGSIDIEVDGKTLERATPGAIIGEMALVDPSARSATAIAHEDCKPGTRR
jgi:CRP-like cAMP-binding protein